MTRFTDKLRLVEISMYRVDGVDVTPDCEKDFFKTYLMRYNEIIDAFIVDDVDLLIDEAYDWERGEGDYEITDDDNEDEFWNEVMDRRVDIGELKLPSDKMVDLVLQLYNKDAISLEEMQELLVR